MIVSLEEMKAQIDELEFQAGVTFSGGDPMMQVEALTELASYVHEMYGFIQDLLLKN